MQYVGIDIGMKKCAVCIMDDERKILEETTYVNHMADASVLARRIAKEYGPCRAVCESTGSMWIKSFEAFEKAGISITLANTRKLKAISEAGAKTDGIDARVLARLLSADMIPACHVPDRRTRGRKQVLRHRISLVQDRTRVTNRAGRLLDKYDVQLPTRSINSARSLRMLAGATLLDPDDEYILHRMVQEIKNLNEEIADADKRIRGMALNNGDARLIMSMPGFDAFGATLLALEIDGIKRFRTAKQLVSWAGMCPTVHQSGKSLYHGRMKKDSNRRVNWMLNQAAHTSVRCDDRMKEAYDRARKAHPHQVAGSHVANKMLTVIWNMLQNETTYDAKQEEAYARKIKRLLAQ